MPMDDHDAVVTVASVSESVVAVSVPIADVTLMEGLGSEGPIEGSFCAGEVEGDGGEIMVEVVGSDVFVDGVSGGVGGGDLNGDGSGFEVGKEGLEREMESIDGNGGLFRDLGSRDVGDLGQEIAVHDVVAEEVGVMVNDEALESGNKSTEEGVCVLTSHRAGMDEEAQNSGTETEAGTSLVIAGSSSGKTQAVTEKVMAIVSEEGEEGMERGLAEQRLERDIECVDGMGADHLMSQEVGILNDGVWNPGIEAGVVCSSMMSESLTTETQVVPAEFSLKEEGSNCKDEVPGGDVVEVNLPFSEKEQGSSVERFYAETEDSAVHTNAEFLDQQADVAGGDVGMMNKEATLHSQVEVPEANAFDGNLQLLMKDQQMKIKPSGESSESYGNLHLDSLSFPELTNVVAGSEAAAEDGEVSSNPDVEALNYVDLSGIGSGVGEVSTACADSGSSIKQSQAAADHSVAKDDKVSIVEAAVHVSGVGESLAAEKRGAFDENIDWNSEIEAGVVCSPLKSERMSTQAQVVQEEVDVMIKGESLNCKDEVPNKDVMEVNLPCLEKDRSSSVEMLYVETNGRAVCANAEFLDQRAKIAGGDVGMMNKEESLHSKVHVTETNVFDGNLHFSAEDRQMKTKPASESSESHGNLGVDSLSFEATKVVAGGEVAAVDYKVSSSQNVEDPPYVGLSGIGGGVGEVSITCADSGTSIEQTQVAADYCVTYDDKVSVSDSTAHMSGVGEVLTAENRGSFGENIDCVEGQEVENVGENCKSNIAVCTEPESSSEQIQVVNGNEITAIDIKVPNPEVDAPTTDIDGTPACSEDFQNVKCETSSENAGKDGVIPTDPESLYDQARVAERGDVAEMDIEEALDWKDEVTRIDALGDNSSCSGKDQELKVEKVETMGESSQSDVAEHPEPDNSPEQTKVVNGNEVAAMDSKAPNPEAEYPTTDMDGRLACSENTQNVKCGTTGGNAGKDGVVPANSESSCEQDCVAEGGEVYGMDTKEVLDWKDEVSGSGSLGGNLRCSGKDQQLKVEKFDGSSENDVAQGHLESSGELICVADRGDIASMDNLSVDDKKVADSNNEVLDGDTTFRKDEKLKALTVGRSMGTEGVLQEGAESSGEQTHTEIRAESLVFKCRGTVAVPACDSLDGNISISVKDVDLKEEAADGSVVEDGVVDKDPSLGADVCDTSIMRTYSATYEENKDEKQDSVVQQAETLTPEVDRDQSMKPLIVDEISNEGPCNMALSNTVAEVAVGSQAALNCATFHCEGDPVPSSINDFASPLLDVFQGAEVHVVSNDISELEGDQTMETLVSDVVTFSEVVIQAIEVKDETSKADDNPIVCDHVLEAKVSEFCDNESMMGSVVVDMATYPNEEEKWKSQSGAVKENVSLTLQFAECLDGSAVGNCTGVGSDAGDETEVEEQHTAGEQVDLHREHETEVQEQITLVELSGTEHISEQMTLKPGSSVTVHQSCYFLPPENEGEFSVSDLVWGKVRSHPWWPGQIFDPADASEKAMKYHKKDCFLVAYFGDRTFAWNDASLLKPFRTNFSQIEKQSNSEAFHNAVGCALEEVSRRVELGLACSCIPKDAYDQIESQIVENTGIRQESSRRYGVDKSTGVSSFEPDKLVENIRALAQSPSHGGDGLELVIAKAQLLAFCRFKGHCQLPEFQFYGGLLENDADTSRLSEVVDHATPVSMDSEQIFSGEGKLKGENSSHKRKHNLKDSVYSRKKEKRLLEDVAYSPDGEDGPDASVMNVSILSSTGKKRKALDSVTDGSDRRISFYAAKVSTTGSPIPKPSFKVGECIRRVASQLTGSPSIVKCSSEQFLKVDGRGDQPVGFDLSLQTPENSERGRMIVPTDYSSLDEMLNQLCMAARDPMKGYSFLNTIITFFSGFRHSISLGPYSGRRNSSTGRVGGGRKKKASHAIGSPEEFEFDDVNDSYWRDRIIQNYSEEQLLPNGQNGEGEYQLVAFEPDKPVKPSRRSYSRKRFSSGNHEMEEEEPTEIDERKQDLSPTGLVLNFTERDSVPSEMALNKMFRRFGPLKDSETEVDRQMSRAIVVFKRGCDAEVAFSSAGKFNIFGPMPVNYELCYIPSISFKTLPPVTLQGQVDAT